MKLKNIYKISLSVLLAFTLVFMYPVISAQSIDVLKSKLNFFTSNIAYADGSNSSSLNIYKDLSQPQAKRTEENKIKTTDQLLKEYGDAQKREKEEATFKSIDDYYTKHEEELTQILGGPITDWGPEQWDTFNKMMKADEAYKQQEKQLIGGTVEIFATSALQMINGLTQSINGYYDSSTGQYVKSIDSDKLSNYVTTNIMPNFLTSSAKMFGKMVEGATGAAVGGFIMSMVFGIGKFCKAWFAPPPTHDLNIDPNNALYAALDKQTGKIMSAIDENKKIMEENFEKLSVEIEEQSLQASFNNILTVSNNLYSKGLKYDYSFKTGNTSAITMAIPSDLVNYYCLFLPTFYDNIIGLAQEDIEELTKYKNQLTSGTAEYNNVVEQIDEYNTQIVQYKCRAKWCISQIEYNISSKAKNFGISLNDVATAAESSTSTASNVPSDLISDYNELTQIKSSINYDLNYAGAYRDGDNNGNWPLACDVYTYIMQKRNNNLMMYNYSKCTDASQFKTDFDYGNNYDTDKEEYLINDNDYRALYSIYLKFCNTNNTAPSQDDIDNKSFEDIGTYYGTEGGLKDIVDNYIVLKSNLTEQTFVNSLSKFIENGENKYFKGAKVNNAYDAFFTLKLNEASKNDKNDYNESLSKALISLRDFHDQNMYALSSSLFMWNCYCVCSDYQKHLGKPMTNPASTVSTILNDFSKPGTGQNIDELYQKCVEQICTFEEVEMDTSTGSISPYDAYYYFNQQFADPFQAEASLTFSDGRIQTYKSFKNAWKDANTEISNGKNVILTLNKDIHTNNYLSDGEVGEPIEFTGAFNKTADALRGATLVFNMNGYDYYYNTSDAIRIAKPSNKEASSESHHNVPDTRGLFITSDVGIAADGSFQLKQKLDKEGNVLTSHFYKESKGSFVTDADPTNANVDDKPSVAVINGNYGSDAHDYNFRRRAVHGPKLQPMDSKNDNVEIWTETDKSNILQSLNFKMQGIEISDAPRSAICIAGNLDDSFTIDNCIFNNNPDCAIELCEFSKINISNTTFNGNRSKTIGNKNWNTNQGGAAVRLKNLNVFNTSDGGILKPFEWYYIAYIEDRCPEDKIKNYLKPERYQIERNAAALGWVNQDPYRSTTSSGPRVVFDSCVFDGNIAENGDGGAIWIEDPIYCAAQFNNSEQRYTTDPGQGSKNWTKITNNLTEGVDYKLVKTQELYYNAVNYYDLTLSYLNTCYMEDYFTFKNCKFTNNESIQGNGGCVSFKQDTFTFLWPSVTLDNCNFESNNAAKYGAVLYIEDTHLSTDEQHIRHTGETSATGSPGRNSYVYEDYKPVNNTYCAFQRTKIKIDGDNYLDYWKNNSSASSSPNAQVECAGKVDVFTTHASTTTYHNVSSALGSWIESELLGDTKVDGGRMEAEKYWAGRCFDYIDNSRFPASHWYYSCASEELDSSGDAATNAAIKYPGSYNIVLSSSQDRMFDVDSSNTDDGSTVWLWSAYGSKSEQYRFIYNESEKTYFIQDVNSGKYLDIVNSDGKDSTNSDAKNGKAIQIWGYSGNKTQQWKINDLGNGKVQFVSAADDKFHMSTDNGANLNSKIVLSNSENDAYSEFTLKQVWETSYGFTYGSSNVNQYAGNDYQLSFNLDKNQVVSVKGDSVADGAHLEMRHNTNAASQWWHFECDADGLFQITNKNSGKYLSIVDDAVGISKYIVQKSSGDTLYQKWKIVRDSNGFVKFVSAADESYEICVFNYHTEDGAEVRLYKANGDQWRSFKLSNEEYKLAKKLN